MTVSLTTEELTAYKSKCDGWNMEYTAWLLEQANKTGASPGEFQTGRLNLVELRSAITKYRETHPFPTLVKI